MKNEEAKQRLQQAATLPERVAAMDVALDLGMTLAEIEDYLDWLDTVRPPCQRPQLPEPPASPGCSAMP
jgi:DNA-binding transcriptional MerR regulator